MIDESDVDEIHNDDGTVEIEISGESMKKFEKFAQKCAKTKNLRALMTEMKKEFTGTEFYGPIPADN